MQQERRIGQNKITGARTTMRVIVIGAGIGGLCCGAKLAKDGNHVLILEENAHIGGTSYIFSRGEYSFPMGPLAFSYPRRVKTFLAEAGANREIEFRRNHFQLVTPYINIIYSQPLDDLGNQLKKIFPGETVGIDSFVTEMRKIIALTKDIDQWHPKVLLGKKRDAALRDMSSSHRERLTIIEEYSSTPAAEFLDSNITDEHLKNLLGSQGTSPPEMSMLLLAFMWNLMSDEGIWFPSCGIHGLSDMLRDALLASGGEVKLDSPVKKILAENGMALGVETENNDVYRGDWIVSNVGQKKTFLELISSEEVPSDYLNLMKTVPYTQSEFCVYLGINPMKVDLSRMKADHLFFRKEIAPGKAYDAEDFDNREIEICMWSKNAPASVPEGRASLILRVSFSHERFSSWRTGKKLRIEGYSEYKKRLANNLIQTVEAIFPGLASSVEVMEIATPLTYQDWGNRFQGAVAGWTWSAEFSRLIPNKSLIETPIRNLLMTGLFAASELYLGGVPTSMHTATLASDFILEHVQHL